MDWLNSIVQGVLLGGLYALFATGLALIFGVMRLVNIAHGDLIVLAAFVALVCTQATGLPALLALPVVVPLMAALGYGLQRGLLNRTLLDRTSGGVHPAAAPGHLRPLDHPAEPAARDLHRRQPAAAGRRRSRP